MNTFGDRLPVAFEKGNGVMLTSTDGEEYYDFMGGIAVSSLGHNYKPLVDTIINQASKVIHTSSLYYIENQAVLAELLCENTCAEKLGNRPYNRSGYCYSIRSINLRVG